MIEKFKTFSISLQAFLIVIVLMFALFGVICAFLAGTMHNRGTEAAEEVIKEIILE